MTRKLLLFNVVSVVLCLSHTTRTWFFWDPKKETMVYQVLLVYVLGCLCLANPTTLRLRSTASTQTRLWAGHLLSGSPWLIDSHKVICHLIDHRVATTDGASFTPLYLLPVWEIMCAYYCLLHEYICSKHNLSSFLLITAVRWRVCV